MSEMPRVLLIEGEAWHLPRRMDTDTIVVSKDL